MQSDENQPIELQSPQTLQASSMAVAPVAPWWHTAVLIAGVILLSISGASQFSQPHVAEVNRLQTYAFTAGTELLMVGWIYFGLRLRKVPFRSLLGDLSGGMRSFFIDLGSAMLFWVGALCSLATIGLFWAVAEAAIKHHSLLPQPGKPIAPDPSQEKTLHTLTSLVPANGHEVLAWIVLCLIAGFAEEVIFRGYLQRQFTAWSRGAIAMGVGLSAAMFGAAHGYQGARNMVLLAIFGALFSGLVLLRRNLRAAIIAHSWHDLIAGLLLAALKAHHRV